MSPAYVGTLKARARTVAEQMALKAFILSPIPDFRVVKDGSSTANLGNEAHDSRLGMSMQGFLHVNEREDLT